MPIARPLFANPDHVTGMVTGGPVLGKTFVKYAAGGTMSQLNIAPAAAGETPAGVAAHDGAVGQAIHLITHDHIPVVAAVDLVVGDLVKVGADGKADKALVDDRPVGIVAVAAAAGADAGIFLY
ncbi:hypothetical protein [Glutamicibacter ardleyensis]|uniref:hypothetical protein n=1 Tax=Glutamicibacter ardleyensis TaxID=225894 RepID=UPI003FCF0BD4